LYVGDRIKLPWVHVTRPFLSYCIQHSYKDCPDTRSAAGAMMHRLLLLLLLLLRRCRRATAAATKLGLPPPPPPRCKTTATALGGSRTGDGGHDMVRMSRVRVLSRVVGGGQDRVRPRPH
jgi:hypothetical protein